MAWSASHLLTWWAWLAVGAIWLCRLPKTAETPVPPFEIRHGSIQVGCVKVRPHAVCEEKFRVGRLPEQEIRKPLFAAGANEQIDVFAPGINRRSEQLLQRVG